MQYFETERLIIRRFIKSDYEDLYDYLSLPEVVRFEPYAVFTLDACRKEVKLRAENEAFWAVCLKRDNKVIGNLYFKAMEPPHFKNWEIGYVFNPRYQGFGYATESARELMDYAFRELGAHRVQARCNPLNEKSWRVMERLGMQREAHLKENVYFKKDDQGQPLWQDTYEYAMLASHWHGRSWNGK